MTTPRRLLVQLRPTPDVLQSLASLRADPQSAIPIVAALRAIGFFVRPFQGGLTILVTLQLPDDYEPEGSLVNASAPGVATTVYFVRGDVADPQPDFDQRLLGLPFVAAAFSDPEVDTTAVCPNGTPIGIAIHVGKALRLKELGPGFDGTGVRVAVIDTGLNMTYLQYWKGCCAVLDADSFTLLPPYKGPSGHYTWPKPGELPIGHGTMCAFDVSIAAPRSTLLDIAIFDHRSGPLNAQLLSDAFCAYSILLFKQIGRLRNQLDATLVVNNSWGVYDPTTDEPPDSPFRYIDNPEHPFNRAVHTLAWYGADIVFSAGNCGNSCSCPDSRCTKPGTKSVYGANSHRDVTAVGGVTVEGDLVGYSSTGGWLVAEKPDVCAFTEFGGSGVFGYADRGTSAAAAVATGVIAAVRTRFRLNPNDSKTWTRALRQALRESVGPTFRAYLGRGIINSLELKKRLGIK